MSECTIREDVDVVRKEERFNMADIVMNCSLERLEFENEILLKERADFHDLETSLREEI